MHDRTESTQGNWFQGSVPSRFRAALALVLALVASLALVGCGSSGGDEAHKGSKNAVAKAKTPKPEAASATAPTASESTSGTYDKIVLPDVSATAQDSDGNIVDVTMSYGTPQVASESSGDVSTCDDYVSRASSDLSRSIVVPITYSVHPKSSMSVDIALTPDDTYSLLADGNLEPTLPAAQVRYFGDEGYHCFPTLSSPLSGGHTWKGGGGSVTDYQLLLNAITPADPHGLNAINNLIFPRPIMALNGRVLTTFTYDKPVPPNVVTCELSVQQLVYAVDPRRAKANDACW